MISMGLKSSFKKFLGIDDLENKVRILETEKAELENKAIEAEKSKELIRKTARECDLTQSTSDAFRELGIYVSRQSKVQAKVGIDAVEAVRKYGLKRFVPQIDRVYPKAVISIEEFRAHPEEYAHKLKKGIIGFPLNLNLKRLNEYLYDNYGNIHIDTSDGSRFQMAPNTVLRIPDSSTFGEVMMKSTELANLRRVDCNSWIYMDVPDFLHNFDGLVNMINDSNLDADKRRRGIEALYITKATYMTALEITGTAQIRDASELLDCKGYDKRYTSPENLTGARKLKEDIRSMLTTDMPGTTRYDIEKRVPIRSIENFRELCSIRTLEIIAKDSENKGLTSEIGKDLKDYSIGESVVLACYFARNVIQKAADLEDTIKEIFSDKSDSLVSGKCSDYAGMALQYLNEYLVPLNPEKFAGWNFGVESSHISSYDHVYLKIIHENENGQFDVYFVDPTHLASKGIKELKTPKDVIDYSSANRNPLEIVRDAEDFLREPIK